MDFLVLGSFASFVLGFSLFFISLFLIFIVLIQRGRGGGLSGALGGTGQSAFGSKAGDEMTYITLIVSAIWIFLCIVCIWILNPLDSTRLIDDDDIQQTSDSDEDNTGLDLGGQMAPDETQGEAMDSDDEAATADDPSVKDNPGPSDDAAPADSETDDPDSPGSDSDTDDPDSPGSDSDTDDPDSPGSDSDTDDPDSPGADSDTDNPDSPGTDSDTDNPDSPDADSDTSNPDSPG